MHWTYWVFVFPLALINSAIQCGGVHRYWFVHAGEKVESNECTRCGRDRERPWIFRE